jgi:hypothetical protein
MSAVDVPVALLEYERVGSAVHRLLDDAAHEIERATAGTPHERYPAHRVLCLAVSPRGAHA